MKTPDAITAIAPVVAALERLGVRYYLGGSLASSVYGRARATQDADLVATLGPGQVEPLAAALQGAYYINAATVRDAVARHACFNVIHLATMFKVDVFVVKNRDFDRGVFDRIRSKRLDSDDPATEFFVASPEDVVLAKLEWYRLGDEISERQWSDVLGVLKVQAGGLDRAYMQRWAAELGVADLLEKAWNEGGL